MSRIVLSLKMAKLMKLWELEGYKRLYDLPKACTSDSVSSAIPKRIPRAMREVYAARRFTLLSAIAVSFLSAAFSSSRFCCSNATTSRRPSSLAQAINVP